MPPTVKFNAPGQCESISCQVEITQVLWQNAVVFLGANRHSHKCVTENNNIVTSTCHLSVILPAPMRASSFYLQVPSRQNARQPHQACFLMPQEKSRPFSQQSPCQPASCASYIPRTRVMPSVSLSAMPLNDSPSLIPSMSKIEVRSVKKRKLWKHPSLSTDRSSPLVSQQGASWSRDFSSQEEIGITTSRTHLIGPGNVSSSFKVALLISHRVRYMHHHR